MADDPGLTCVAFVARMHGVTAEPAQLRHALGLTSPATPDDLLRV